MGDCKEKCKNNEAPDGCPSKICKYVMHDENPWFPPGWCQLASDECKSFYKSSINLIERKCWKSTSFKSLGKAKSCHNAVYTRVGSCDGWARISLDECKRKCQ